MRVTLFRRLGVGRNRTGSRTAPAPYLTDAQWLLIADLFPYQRTTKRGGRPPVPPRQCLEGILWVLVSGARWKDLPERYPSPSTCWRRLNEWVGEGLLQQAWSRLLGKLGRLRHIDWEETIGDGTFAPAKKGARR
jgi:transposase